MYFHKLHSFQSSSSVRSMTAKGGGAGKGHPKIQVGVLCSRVLCLLSGPYLWPWGKQGSSESDWAIPLAPLGGHSFLSKSTVWLLLWLPSQCLCNHAFQLFLTIWNEAAEGSLFLPRIQLKLTYQIFEQELRGRSGKPTLSMVPSSCSISSVTHRGVAYSNMDLMKL